MHPQAPPPPPASDLMAPCNATAAVVREVWQLCTALTLAGPKLSTCRPAPRSQVSATAVPVSYRILFRLSTSFAFAIVPLHHGRIT
jgi:hypothetical protein